MNQWTRARKLAFAVHVAFVSVPFLASSVSAFLLWRDLFGSWLLAVPMVAVIDILALTGLLLFIVRGPSPFALLRLSRQGLVSRAKHGSYYEYRIVTCPPIIPGFVWEDKLGPITVLAVAAGYAMARRPRVIPFVVAVKEIREGRG